MTMVDKLAELKYSKSYGKNCYKRAIKRINTYSGKNGEHLFSTVIDMDLYVMLDDGETKILDAFCRPSTPFEIRTEEDAKSLIFIMNEFQSDLNYLEANDSEAEDSVADA